MARKTLSLAILFADIAKSTLIYETLGNIAAKKLIDNCISLFSKVTEIFQGTVIKTMGDEIMCIFPTADDAMEAAVEMHRGLDDMAFPEKPDYGSPNIYVGIQFGPVIMEGNDVFGDAVNVAARMVAFAKPRQIITTEETVELLSAERQDSAICIDNTTIKGKSGVVRIYEVVWEDHDVTVMLDDTPGILTIRTRLKLAHHDQAILLDENRPSATLGRQMHNDIVVNDNRVSRSHARIEYNRGKFFIIDQSTNGTFIAFQGKKSIHLKREQKQLLASGVIGLGRDVTPKSPQAIHFAIKFSRSSGV